MSRLYCIVNLRRPISSPKSVTPLYAQLAEAGLTPTMLVLVITSHSIVTLRRAISPLLPVYLIATAMEALVASRAFTPIASTSRSLAFGPSPTLAP